MTAIAKPKPGATNNRQRQREQTRRQILEAAAGVFARAGFDAASLAEIARRAGVKKALVQYHFSTKELLWQEAATFTWNERNSYMAEHLAVGADTSSLDGMRQGFTALVAFTRKNPNWLWFMFHEAAVDSDRLAWLIDNCMRDDYVLGENFVRQFQAQGLIRKGSPIHLLHLISGALTYNLLVAPSTLRATGVDLTDEEEIAQQVALLAELLGP